ncbi:phage P2 baseplate assembly protein gpV [Vibrio vulnificus]|uniref:phage baseplate assembly protein V n=1 Tax=Vibrio vulnificus TaxID=672 RepID=UPI0009C50113|nr:phage P2 baseplate assembly protein gpV [Vibrio vulnificus]
MEFTPAQLVRLLSEMIQFGTIIEVQTKPLRYKVRFDEHRVSGWIPMNVSHAAEVRSWKPLQVGEQVVVLKPFGAQGGVIVASLNQTKFDQPKEQLNLYYHEFPDGTWLEYDMDKHVLSGFVSGKVNLVVESEFRLESPKIIFVGDIEHDGTQRTTGDIYDGVRSMAEDRDIYNDHDHPHGDPIVGKVNQKQ